MLNNIFPLPVQAASQAVGPGDATPPTPVIAPFESSALWVDDQLVLDAIGF